MIYYFWKVMLEMLDMTFYFYKVIPELWEWNFILGNSSISCRFSTSMSGIFLLENRDSTPLFHASPCLSRLRTPRPDLLQRSKIPQLYLFKTSGLCALNIQDSTYLSFLDLGLHALSYILLWNFVFLLIVLIVRFYPSDGSLVRPCSKTCTHYNLIDQRNQMNFIMKLT